MKNINPTKTQAWKKLNEHFEDARFFEMKNLFDQDEERSKKLSLEWEDFYVDLSKNIITEETQKLLLELADEVDLKNAVNLYFEGGKINKTEGRAVLHTALRADKTDEIKVEGENIIPDVFEVKKRISRFTEDVISGARRGYTGKAFTDIVNIGIGGSDLGPLMVVESLKYYKNHLETHFISNVDGDHVWETLKKLNPETTLVVVVSKSFSTLETLSNATTVRNWFAKKAPEEAVSKHFVAVSSNVQKVEEFGIEKENIFPMWDWVGGRFSLWSAVGLSIALAIGYPNFESLLSGAHSMDEHFRKTDFKYNIPVQLALLSIWYNNFFKAESEAVIPYTQYLHRLPAYLQQAVMESNGKGVDRNGEEVNYQTGNIIWGEPGTNSQHAFFQLIHQGTKMIPADFIGFIESLHGEKEHHDKLMANFFAQTEALLIGKSRDEVEKELSEKKIGSEGIEKIAAYKIFKGNKPTTSILIKKLTPNSLGKLIAMYEHKIFVQGIVWNIFSYDQWGVELGKQLATNILDDLNRNTFSGKQHVSTKTLLEQYYKSR